jgi:hypothetical protein
MDYKLSLDERNFLENFSTITVTITIWLNTARTSSLVPEGSQERHKGTKFIIAPNCRLNKNLQKTDKNNLSNMCSLLSEGLGWVLHPYDTLDTLPNRVQALCLSGFWHPCTLKQKKSYASNLTLTKTMTKTITLTLTITITKTRTEAKTTNGSYERCFRGFLLRLMNGNKN